jgi:hypothetical protein
MARTRELLAVLADSEQLEAELHRSPRRRTGRDLKRRLARSGRAPRATRSGPSR